MYLNTTFTRRYETLRPQSIDEPPDERRVMMLDALPTELSSYYSAEWNVIDWTGKSETILKQITEQFAFVGGTPSAYVQYFLRKDLPKTLWNFTTLDNVRAYTGFLVVPKKAPGRQRTR